jgi:hypothetical protein
MAICAGDASTVTGASDYRRHRRRPSGASAVVAGDLHVRLTALASADS